MRIPKSIKPGDTIGIVAPSFGAATEPYITRFDASIRAFEARGYRVKTAPSCRKGDGLGISTDPESAAKDVMDFYLDPSVDALISVGGGELMNETISCLDFGTLKKAEPKWFMGYSDNTNMIFPMAVTADTAGIYGPCAAGFGKPWEETEKDAFALLEGTKTRITGYELYELPEAGDSVRKTDPLSPYILTEKKILRTFVPDGRRMREAGADEKVSFKGTLLGGCLDVLVNLSGTKYAAGIERFSEVVWVIEACDLNPMAIRRSLWSLKNQGWFDAAAGFLVGRPLASFRQDMMGVNQYNAVTDVLRELEVPIVADADIGHISPMMPLVIGAEASVTVLGNDIATEMKL